MLTVDKKNKRAKSHHVPTRMCVACGKRDASFRLARFIRTETGKLRMDGKRRLGGRGAYLCVSKTCFEKALTKGLFSRALRGRTVCEPRCVWGDLKGRSVG
jgi:predicted RNA-binding protein YlxR (DUF448 family)